MVNDIFKSAVIYVVLIVTVLVGSSMMGISTDARAMLLGILGLASLVVLPLCICVGVMAFSSGRQQGYGEHGRERGRVGINAGHYLPDSQRPALPTPQEQARADAYKDLKENRAMYDYVAEKAYQRAAAQHEKVVWYPDE